MGLHSNYRIRGLNCPQFLDVSIEAEEVKQLVTCHTIDSQWGWDLHPEKSGFSLNMHNLFESRKGSKWPRGHPHTHQDSEPLSPSLRRVLECTLVRDTTGREIAGHWS